MACPGQGPCDVYPLDLSCCLVSGAFPDSCLLDGAPVPQPVVDNAILVASQILWAATGRQFSTCTVTLRPCRPCGNECCVPDIYDFGFTGSAYGGGYPFFPIHQADGSWINLSCNCVDDCSCTNLCEVKLPYPVCSIGEVRVDGIVLPASEYKVVNFERLIRTPAVSGDCWPRCNDLTKPDTEVGTWSVTLTYGREPDALILFGAAELACELIKSCIDKPCKLPQRISSVTRQGVSVSFLDTMDFLSDGMTGLYFTDLAIRTHNPKNLARRPTVYSPDYAKKWNVET